MQTPLLYLFVTLQLPMELSFGYISGQGYLAKLMQNVHLNDNLAFYGFCGIFLQPFLYFLYITFAPNFIAPTSPHTLPNPLSLRFCICISLSLPVITFCSPGLCRLTHYPLPHTFIARWHTRYLRIHTFIYLWILFVSPLCPSFNLSVSLWFPG